jgi:hypothetical protein
MTHVIPWYITVTVVLISVGLGVIVWAVLARVATRSVRIGAGMFLAAWFAALVLLAPPVSSLTGASPYYVNPLVGAFAALPALLVAIAAGISAAVRRAFATASLPALTGVQAERVAGVIFLILLAQGQLPARFALGAGWGDIIVGALALPVAFALKRGAPSIRALAIGWNVLGLIDLFSAVGTGTGVLGHMPSALIMGAFPMILVPGFVVPICVVLHVICLVRLARVPVNAPYGDRKTVAA